jgi:hypothetical protein
VRELFFGRCRLTFFLRADVTTDAEVRKDGLRLVIQLLDHLVPLTPEIALGLGLQLGAFNTICSALEQAYDPQGLELAVTCVHAFLNVSRRWPDASREVRYRMEEAGIVRKLQQLEASLPSRLPLCERVSAVREMFADEGGMDEDDWASFLLVPSSRSLGSEDLRQRMTSFQTEFSG